MCSSNAKLLLTATQRNFAIDLYALEKLLIFMEFKLKGDKNR